MMRLMETLVPQVAQEVLGTTVVAFEGQEIELKAPWPRVDIHDALREHAGIDLDEFLTAQALADRMRELHVPATYAESRGRLVDKLLGHFVEPKLIQPTFLVGHPVEMSPLAKASRENPLYAERFEAFAAGMEIANSFTELNNPDVQRQRFEEQEALGSGIRERTWTAWTRTFCCPGAWDAADGRPWDRHRPTGHAHYRPAVDPRREDLHR